MTARPERVAAEEVRQRMLDAGQELALEAGAALTIEHLRLEEVIQRARVPRSSVYRMWPYREEYTDDLLCYLAGAGSFFSDRTLIDPETFSMATRVLTDHPQLLGSAAGRRALLCEVVRLTCARNYQELSGSAPWRLHMALIATLGSTRSGQARRRIAAALEDSQRRSRDSIIFVLSHFASALGVRMRDPAYTLDHVQLAGGLLVQALALRNVQVQTALAPPEAGPAAPGSPAADTGLAGGPDLTEPIRVNQLLNAPIPGPGLDGEPAQWTLAAFSYLGVVDAFMELDPDFTPPGS